MATDTRKPTKRELAARLDSMVNATANLLAALRANPDLLQRMHRPESVHAAMVRLLAALDRANEVLP